ncbi:DUF302 domain-containing protein [Acidimangrovimonas sediminis]|uniref:DUF302 domain-containing protein n=1 Tax=Acidimangrovimonas sediminis TaxID=2056283 RepID=UPI000C80DD7C|nr:DUF302 domain-containing protein [Acidimangrovimonas sediminis]
MTFLRNLMAIIGVVALVAVLWVAWSFRDLDPKAPGVYWNMAKTLAATGNAAEATVWKAKVKAGLSFDDVDQSIQSAALADNIKDVGNLPLGDQVSAMQGKPWRKLKIYLYCNPLTAAKMVDYSEAYSAYLPCRIALVEDKSGQLWLYSLNMDMMIWGGKPLPPDLKKEALHVREVILDIMKKGANGDF